tara:strand:+ start:2868 stop:4919 length:2052 start_codon:yes stop_codon:yes gene_type:complete
MAQYGLLESFRNLNELSVNEYKRRASRRSLLLGDFALQFSNDVNIVGDSSLAVKEFSLKSNLDPNSNLFLSSSNVDGTVVFKELDLPSWAYSNYQHDIMIGNFSNDNKLQRVEELSPFVYDESILHLSNRPKFTEIASDYGYTESFLNVSSNLSELNKTIARTNLGLSNLATFNTVARIENVNVSSNITLNNLSFQSNNFLYLNAEKNVISQVYEFPLIHSVLSNDSSNIPSSVLLSNIYSQLSNNMGVTSTSNKQFIIDNEENIKSNISNDVLFNLDDNFLDLSPSQKQTLNNNLNMSNIVYQNSNSVSVQSMIVENTMNFTDSNVIFYNENFIPLDTFFNFQNPGFIKLSNAATYDDMSNNSNEIHSKMSEISDTIINSFDDLSNDLFKSNQNLQNISNKFIARANLGLSVFAMDGRLKTLSNRPLFLSEFINDKNYVSKYDNLHTMEKNKIIENLGIKAMAFEDADNIGGEPNALYALGLGNLKFHSTETIIDVAFVDEGEFYLKSAKSAMEADPENPKDFLSIQYDSSSTKEYEYIAIEKLDADWYTTYYPNIKYENEYLRVRVNDNSNLVFPQPIAGIPQPIQPQLKTLIRDNHYVPTAQFTYDKFVEMTSNILTTLEIPFEYYTNGYSNILAVDKIPDYVIIHQSTEEYEKIKLGKGDLYYRDITQNWTDIISYPPS